MTDKLITDLQELTSVTEDTYVPVRNATAGTRKYNLKALSDAVDEATDAAETAADAADEAAGRATAAAEQAEGFVLAHHALLGAGTSDALLSGDADVDTFAQRTSDHGGGRRIASLRGNTVRWNQLAASGSAETKNGVTFTLANGSAQISGTATANTYKSITGSFPLTENHVYLFKGSLNVTDCYAYVNTTIPGGNGITGNGVIKTAPATVSTNITVYIASGTVINTSVIPQVFDLTAMFGSGNEPQTVAEFERMFPADYYPYDAGSLLSVNVSGVESAGATREIPAATYFPDGMRGISTAGKFDELTPTYAKQVMTVFRLAIDDMNNSEDFPGWSGVAGILDVFPSGASTSREANTNYGMGKVIGFNTIGNNRIIFLPKAQFGLTQSEWKAQHAGETCELQVWMDNPIVTPIDPPLNLTYPTERGGTESIIVPTGSASAPPTMAIVYAYDADGVRDVSQSIVAPVENGSASANYAVGSYLVRGGTLYRVTSAIATGETIAPGTNVTATTVMAEIIRLTA